MNQKPLYHPAPTITGSYTIGPPTLRARALECALSLRQRKLVMGLLPWSAADQHRLNHHHYRRTAWNLIARINAAGVEAHLTRLHVPRPHSTGATHRLVLMLGPKDRSFPCECHGSAPIVEVSPL